MSVDNKGKTCSTLISSVPCSNATVVHCGGCNQAACANPEHIIQHFFARTNGIYYFYYCPKCKKHLCTVCVGALDNSEINSSYQSLKLCAQCIDNIKVVEARKTTLPSIAKELLQLFAVSNCR